MQKGKVATAGHSEDKHFFAVSRSWRGFFFAKPAFAQENKKISW